MSPKDFNKWGEAPLILIFWVLLFGSMIFSRMTFSRMIKNN